MPFVVAAAVAAERIKWDEAWAPVVSWSQRLAVPVGLGIAACLYLQAVFGVLPLGHADPTARALGAGWKELAAKLDYVRTRIGAPIVLDDGRRHRRLARILSAVASGCCAGQ